MIKLDRVMKEDNATKIGVFVVGFVGILIVIAFIITLFTDPEKAKSFVWTFIPAIFGLIILLAFSEE